MRKGTATSLALAIGVVMAWSIPGEAAPPSQRVTAPRALSRITSQKPVKGPKFYRHQFYKTKLANGHNAAANWSPTGGVHVVVTDPKVTRGLKLVSRSKVIRNPVRRLWHNVGARLSRSGATFAGFEGKPMKGVSPRKAATLLGNPSGQALLKGYGEMLDKVTKPGNVFKYERQ